MVEERCYQRKWPKYLTYGHFFGQFNKHIDEIVLRLSRDCLRNQQHVKQKPKHFILINGHMVDFSNPTLCGQANSMILTVL